jgi:hypothetical protein
MKNPIILVVTLAAITLGAVCLLQSRKVNEQKTQIAALRGETEQQAQQIIELKAAQEQVETQRRELSEQVLDLSSKLMASRGATGPVAVVAAPTATAPAQGAKPESEMGGMGNFLAKMMADPETKKMIRAQQRLMLDQIYSPLIKQMGLSAEEAEQFRNLLADHTLKSAEKATALLGGAASTNRAELTARLTEEQKAFDEQVRSLLGESRYAQYQDYQQTAGERAQLNQFRQQFSGESAVTDQQTEQLLAFMKEAKQAVGGLEQPQDAASMQAMLSGEGIEKLLQNQEAAGRQVYERARGVLSDSQLAAFGRFQTNQYQMMRMGMSVARKFLSPEDGPGNGTP